MNSNLLSLVDQTKVDTAPFMLDNVPAPDDPEAGPFLVTSSKDMLWVDRAFRGGFLRIAVRPASLLDVYRRVVEVVAEKGVERAWGNVLPATKEGIVEGLAYLSYFDLPDTMLIYGEDFDIGLAPELERSPAEWLPPTWGVLVPAREYVGTAYLFGGGHIGALVHNPSRGIVVLRGSNDAGVAE